MAKSPAQILVRVPAFAPILAKKPGILKQVARSHYLAKIKHLDVIRALEVGVTYSCQATCDKCSASLIAAAVGQPDRPKLSLSEYRRVGDDAWKRGCYEVNFTGGEPLLAPELDDIIPMFHPEGTFMGLNTNGELLSRTRIEQLRDLGIDLLKISLDNPSPEDHDRSRGLPGLFDHIMEVLEITRHTRGIRAHLVTVATKDNIRSGAVAGVLAIARHYGATLGVVYPSPVGGWEGQEEVSLNSDDHKLLRPIVSDPLVFNHGNLGGGDDFRCPCGTDEIYVTCYGDIMPCPFVQISFGNINDEGFDASYLRMAHHPDVGYDHHMCMASENAEFRRVYLRPLEGRSQGQMPCHIDEHPHPEARK